MCDRCIPSRKRPKNGQKKESKEAEELTSLVTTNPDDRRFSGQYQSSSELNANEEDKETLKGLLMDSICENDMDAFKLYVEKIMTVLKKEIEEEVDTNKGIKKEDERQAFVHLIEEDVEYPVLTAAARYHNLEVLKFLIECGANKNITNDIGNNALHDAAWGQKIKLKTQLDRAEKIENEGMSSDIEARNEAVVDYLISQNLDPNAKDTSDQTPLHNSAIRGNAASARALLRCKNTNINMQDIELQTPLHLAVILEHIEVCELLVKANAMVHLKDRMNCTPLHYAASVGNCQLIELLLNSVQNEEQRKKFINMQARHYESPLTMAIRKEREEAVKLLIRNGANVASKHQKSSSTLHIACYADNVNILQILLDNGADVNSKNADSETPLHVACGRNNEVKIVEYLLSHNADLEAKDSEGRTPLLNSCQNDPSEDNLKIIKILVEHGANTHAIDKTMKTIAIYFAEQNNVEAFKYLMSLDGCKDLLEISDKQNNLPIHYAASRGNVEILKYLVENGCKLNAINNVEDTPLHRAVYNGHLKAAEYLLDRYEKLEWISELDSGFSTPLHWAAINGDCDMVKLLISKVPNPSVDILEKRNGEYYTALDCAAVHGQKDVAKILLNSGSKVDGGESFSNSALHAACQNGHVNVVNLLLNTGASIDRLDGKNRNCLEVAIDYNQKEVAKEIISHDSWRDVMRHCRTGSVCFPTRRSTPLRELIATMPEVAAMVLDKCVIPDKKSDIPTYDYELLDDVYSNWANDNRSSEGKAKVDESSFDENGNLRPNVTLYSNNINEVKNMQPVMLMVLEEREYLLGKDIVSHLLNRKWKKYARYIFYLGLFLYVAFLGALTDFAINSTPYYNFSPLFSELPDDFCDNETLTTLNADIIPKAKPHVRVSQYITMIFSIANILKELSQMYYRRKNYFEPQNLIEISLYTCALIFVVDWNKCSTVYGYRVPDQWLFGVAATILAWFNLVLMVRQFPTLGIYVVMFTSVLRTFTKFFTVFFLFVVAFAIGFYMLFQNQAPFTNFRRTLIKTLVMMVGEFEYNGMFYSSSEHNEKAYYPFASQWLFFLFAIIMTILIMNLLVGLAVDDIKGVQNKALLQRLAMKARLILEIEYIAPDVIRRKYMIGKEAVSSTVEKSLLERVFREIFPKGKDESVSEAAKEAAAELFGVKGNKEESQPTEDMNNLAENVTQLQKVVDELKSQQAELKSVLSAIATHLHVPQSTEDDSRSKTTETPKPPEESAAS